MDKIILTKPFSGRNPVIVVAFTTGLLASLTINHISLFLNLSEGIGTQIIAVILFVVIGWFLEYAAPMNSKFKDILKYTGMFCFALAPGVFFDVVIDFFFRHYDRNLFPFEIIMWWILALVPLLIGIIIGRRFFEFREKLP